MTKAMNNNPSPILALPPGSPSSAMAQMINDKRAKMKRLPGKMDNMMVNFLS